MSSTSSSSSSSTTISKKDNVVVNHRFLQLVSSSTTTSSSSSSEQQQRQRFSLQGIAFPVAPPPQAIVVGAHEDDQPKNSYNATGWIAVLEQLRRYLPASALNTVRVYRMDPLLVDYSEFFEAAAKLGFYVMVPLTANEGGGVMDRNKLPPDGCYPRKLYEYGKAALREYLKYPNVVAGMIGNEVMNSLETWKAAPCVKAYARDLKFFMAELQHQVMTNSKLQERYQHRIHKNQLQPLPLSYACQHSGSGAALNSVDTVRLSLDYLTCSSRSGSSGSSTNTEKRLNQESDPNSNHLLNFGIDMLGVNIESWCATGNTFGKNVDGTTGTYYQLWQGLHAHVDVPLFFSEIGCSHYEFNKDTPELRTPEGTRDWKQLPVVLKEMNDTWSGFSAYTYDGNSLFGMMEKGKPWDGIHVLQPTDDFWNFQQQLLLATNPNATDSTTADSTTTATPIYGFARGSLHPLPMQNGGIMEDYYQLMEDLDNSSSSTTTTTATTPIACSHVEDVLSLACNLELIDHQQMPSYFDPQRDFATAIHNVNTQTTSNAPSTMLMSSSIVADSTSSSSSNQQNARNDTNDWELRPRYHKFLWNVLAPIVIVVTGAKLMTFRRWIHRRSSYHEVD